MEEWVRGLATVFGGPLLMIVGLVVLMLGLSLLGPVLGLGMFLVLIYRFLDAGSE